MKQMNIQLFKDKSYFILYFAVFSVVLTGSLESMLRFFLQKRKFTKAIECKCSCDDTKPVSKLIQPKAKGWHRPLPGILILSNYH